jgi:quaternary ammonium compound-resistance protein SugE
MWSWIVLVLSGVLERCGQPRWGSPKVFSRLGASIVFLFGLIASMAGLAYAMRGLPVGTAYAVWVGIGAVLTIVYAMITGVEPLSALKVVFLMMIIGGVIGLKLSH